MAEGTGASLPVEGPEGVSVEVSEAPLREGPPDNEQLKTMADLIRTGRAGSLESAADLVGLSRLELERNRSAVRAAVLRYIQGYHLPPEVQRELVRAARAKVLIEALESGDSATVLKAADAIAGDPDVGLRQAPAPLVNIDISAITDLLERVGEETGLGDLEEQARDGI